MFERNRSPHVIVPPLALFPLRGRPQENPCPNKGKRGATGTRQASECQKTREGDVHGAHRGAVYPPAGQQFRAGDLNDGDLSQADRQQVRAPVALENRGLSAICKRISPPTLILED